MREKLLELMKNEGLRSSQLAEMLGINPAGISHILAGRNKPGFDLLQKILRRFPRISPDWLLLDRGPMYRTEVLSGDAAPAVTTDRMADGLFGQTASQPGASSYVADERTGSSQQLVNPKDVLESIGKSEAIVERVIILYSDQTCESYTPTKR
ncbi:helix-turn-helix domain-containing protein [Alistipes sp.]|uniref:helix-turn-helix domain-containing protein n=1 Tax=Alistipes sp. TaxID=1872444 RepID=UPI003AF0E8CA